MQIMKLASTLHLDDKESEESSEQSSEDSSSEDEVQEEEDPFDGLSEDDGDIELNAITSMLRKSNEDKHHKKLASELRRRRRK